MKRTPNLRTGVGLLLLLTVVLVGVYYLFDPSASGLFPKCRFLELTGYKCPGCGAQRMLHSLLHFDFVTAFRYNAYLLTLFPLFVLLFLWDGWQKWLSRKWADLTTYILVTLFLVSTILWWVLRNVFDW